MLSFKSEVKKEVQKINVNRKKGLLRRYISRRSLSQPKAGLSEEVNIPELEVNIPELEVNIPEPELKIPKMKMDCRPNGDSPLSSLLIERGPCYSTISIILKGTRIMDS